MFSMPPRETNIVQRLRQCPLRSRGTYSCRPLSRLIPARTTWSICKIAPFTPRCRQLSLMKVLSVGCGLGATCHSAALPFLLMRNVSFHNRYFIYRARAGLTLSPEHCLSAPRPNTMKTAMRLVSCLLARVEAISLFGVDLAPILP